MFEKFKAWLSLLPLAVVCCWDLVVLAVTGTLGASESLIYQFYWVGSKIVGAPGWGGELLGFALYLLVVMLLRPPMK